MKLARAPSLFVVLAVSTGVLGCRQVLGIEPLESADPDSGIIVLDATQPRDARATDAGRDADATGDVGDVGPPFCLNLSPPAQGTHQICNDFDEATNAFELGWNNYGQTPDPGDSNGGVLKLDSSNYKSFPRSIRVTTTDNASGGAVEAILLKTIAGAGEANTGSLILEFDLYVDTLVIQSSGFVILAGIGFGEEDAQGIALTFDSKGLNLVVNGKPFGLSAGTEQQIVGPFPTGVWEHVGLLVGNAPADGGTNVDGGTDGWVQVGCDGLGAAASLPAAFQTLAAQEIYVLLGAVAEAPVGPFAANIDNVVLSWGRPFTVMPPGG